MQAQQRRQKIELSFTLIRKYFRGDKGQAELWFLSHNVWLGQSPTDAIHDDRVDEVLDLANKIQNFDTHRVNKSSMKH